MRANGPRGDNAALNRERDTHICVKSKRIQEELHKRTNEREREKEKKGERGREREREESPTAVCSYRWPIFHDSFQPV